MKSSISCAAWIGLLAAAAALLLAPAAALGGPPPFIEAGLGPQVAGLRLAVTVDATGTTALFRVRNLGRRAVTFTERYSCSGLSPWSISAGASAASLDHHFGFEPEAKGLSTAVRTTCTRNVPTRQRTIRPGKTASISVPFASAGEILTMTGPVFRASAVLSLAGRRDLLVLESAPVER